MGQNGAHAALRFAGGDAEQAIAATGQRQDRLADTVIKRLLMFDRMTQIEEGLLVLFDHAVERESIVSASEHLEGFAQRQPDNRQHSLAWRAHDFMGVISALHGGADHVLAVHQRAVTIEDNKFHRVNISHSTHRVVMIGTREQGEVNGTAGLKDGLTRIGAGNDLIDIPKVKTVDRIDAKEAEGVKRQAG